MATVIHTTEYNRELIALRQCIHVFDLLVINYSKTDTKVINKHFKIEGLKEIIFD